MIATAEAAYIKHIHDNTLVCTYVCYVFGKQLCKQYRPESLNFSKHLKKNSQC